MNRNLSPDQFPDDHPEAPCNHEWCKGFPEGWHTNAEHIDPADRDPYSDESMEAKRKMDEVFGDSGNWLLGQNDR